MTPRVWREGEEIRKRLADPQTARRLVLWTGELRAHDLPTPEAQPGPSPDVLVFPAIEGTGGLALIVAGGPPALPDLLRPLLCLHRASLAGLAPFDPRAKIVPRLSAGDPPPLLKEASRRLDEIPEPSGTVPVHGDFHVGQLIRDAEATVWMLDLEDLAAGAPESDLGNFAAHLATRPETRRHPAPQGLEFWSGHTLRAYRAIGGEADAGLAIRYGRVALIRRALKLRERGDPSVVAELLGQ